MARTLSQEDGDQTDAAQDCAGLGRGFALVTAMLVLLTLVARNWAHMGNSLMGVVCMVPPDGRPVVDHWVQAVQDYGRFWISRAQFEGATVRRAWVTNGRTDKGTIDGLSDSLASVQTKEA